MAMDLGGAKGGVKSDINVTPLCDVMLVLLIIMMIVAPLLQQGVSVQLPQATNTVDKPETQGQTVIAIAKDKTMFLIAAGTLRYRDIIEVIDAAKGAGVEKVGIVTEGMRKAAGAGGN